MTAKQNPVLVGKYKKKKKSPAKLGLHMDKPIFSGFHGLLVKTLDDINVITVINVIYLMSLRVSKCFFYTNPDKIAIESSN